jgi:hypothetical protein
MVGNPTALYDRVPPRPGTLGPEALLDLFLGHVQELGISLYPAQEKAILELFTGSNVFLSTPPEAGNPSLRSRCTFLL